MNKGARPSDYISINQSSALIDAVLYAFCSERWLNRFITIHFGKAGIRSHPDAHDVLEDFLKHAGDLLSKRGLGPPHYVYVFENPEGHSLHVHVLLHVPFDQWKSFAKLERGWIKQAVKKFGGRYQKGVLDYRPLFRHREFTEGKASFEDFVEHGMRGILLYLLKGAEAGTPSPLGLVADAVSRRPPKLRPAPQGRIFGKRVGISESLSRFRHQFSRTQIRSGMWMAGSEAGARAVLRDFGLEFSRAASRGGSSPRP